MIGDHQIGQERGIARLLGEPGADGWADAAHTAVAVHPFAALRTDGEGQAPTPFAREWLAAGEAVAAALAPTGDDLDGPAVARAIHEAVPDGAALFLGSSSVARDLGHGVARVRDAVEVVTSRGLAGIDGCVSTAAGLALAIFFLLLLGLSEHIAFHWAYLASAVACIGVQAMYLSGVLRSWPRALGFAAMLTALYGALYCLLVSEDNALLMGSLLLFAILTTIMWITRKVDWYALGNDLR